MIYRQNRASLVVRLLVATLVVLVFSCRKKVAMKSKAVFKDTKSIKANNQPIPISITQAEYVRDYTIKFLFSDGTRKTIDFGDFLQKTKNPATRKYLDKQLFKKYSLEYGDIVWNDFEMCFPIGNLHEGKI